METQNEWQGLFNRRLTAAENLLKAREEYEAAEEAFRAAHGVVIEAAKPMGSRVTTALAETLGLNRSPQFFAEPTPKALEMLQEQQEAALRYLAKLATIKAPKPERRADESLKEIMAKFTPAPGPEEVI